MENSRLCANIGERMRGNRSCFGKCGWSYYRLLQSRVVVQLFKVERESLKHLLIFVKWTSAPSALQEGSNRGVREEENLIKCHNEVQFSTPYLKFASAARQGWVLRKAKVRTHDYEVILSELFPLFSRICSIRASTKVHFNKKLWISREVELYAI
jgi:hypothetical protein